MPRNFIVYKIQCELSCPKSTRTVSGLFRNARQIRDAQNVCAERMRSNKRRHRPLKTSICACRVAFRFSAIPKTYILFILIRRTCPKQILITIFFYIILNPKNPLSCEKSLVFSKRNSTKAKSKHVLIKISINIISLAYFEMFIALSVYGHYLNNRVFLSKALSCDG